MTWLLIKRLHILSLKFLLDPKEARESSRKLYQNKNPELSFKTKKRHNRSMMNLQYY